jgi:prepilin-type N-terminal cleavage/methylation domain-containing protein
MSRRARGFTLIEIMIVTGILGLLSALMIPFYVHSRRESRRSLCVNNLRVIEYAKQQLATSSQSLAEAYVPAMSELFPYFKGAGTPICREGGTYNVNAISNDPTCSLSLSPYGHVLLSEIQR